MANIAIVTASNAEPTSPAGTITFAEEGTEIEITLTGPEEKVRSGQVVTFIITVTNHGPLDATDVKVVFPLHPAFKLNSFFKSKGECERKDPDPRPFAAVERAEVRCVLPKMMKDEVWVIEVTTTAGSLETAAVNRAEVFIQEADVNTSNNQVVLLTYISGTTAADVWVSPNKPSVVVGGKGHVVRILFGNKGPSKATNVRLTVEPGDAVDLSELKLVPSPARPEEAETVAKCSGGCTLGSPSALSEFEIRAFDLTFDSNAENLSIKFRVDASEPDPDPINNQYDFKLSLPKVLTRAALGDGSQHGKLQILEQPSPILPPPAAVTNSAAGNNFDTVSAGSGHTVWGTEFCRMCELPRAASG